MPLQTRWYVITGGPSSGKTSVINHLAFLGYRIIPEASRIHIHNEMSKGRTVEEIRKDENEHTLQLLKMKQEAEGRLNPTEIVFIERGVPDSLAYMDVYGGDKEMITEACNIYRYAGVFYLEPLPFHQDTIRNEDDELIAQLNFHSKKAYEDLGYHVVDIPRTTISDRVEKIISTVNAQVKV